MKITKRIIITLLAVCFLFFLSTAVYHTIKTKQEVELLKQNRYYNPVRVGDHCLNVAKFGNENGSHTIVAMAGLGMGDCSVSMRQMTACLEEDNLVVFVDRAGYGLSDDTNNEMTIEYIVEDYRKALKNAGINEPYILMPHSIGGIYATYWVSNYPEEIEAVVFIDGTQLSENAYVGYEDEYASTLVDYALAHLMKLGFSRFVLKNDFYLYPDNYTKNEQYLGDALSIRTMSSIATLSECTNTPSNAQKAFKEIVTNDVPKLYICSGWGFKTREDFVEYTKWINGQRELNNLGDPSDENPSDEIVDKALKQSEDNRQNILMPYLEKMGNCELICLGGDHMIYEQKPIACGEMIKNFIDGMDD